MDLGELNIPFIRQGDQVVHPNPIRDGLVLWYDFSGMDNSFSNRGIAEDLSGNGNHGTLQNFAYSEGSGYDKRGLLFDGVDDHVGSRPSISENYSGFTVQTTINPAAPSSGLGGVGYIFHWNSDASEGSAPIVLCNSNGTALRWQSQRIDNGRILSYNNALSFGEKTVVTAVRNNNTLLLYLNGTEVSRIQLENSFENKAGVLGIGDAHGASGYRQFDGTIHSTLFYEKALTPEEIAHNYAIEKERFGIGGSEL